MALALCGCGLTRAGYESAPYRTMATDGRFEIREYPALALVSTPMSGGTGSGDSERGSFMRLFGYISGENADGRKIAMTTPVFMEEGEANGSMSFVLPEKVAAGEAPDATVPSVEIRELPGGNYAVYRLSGARSEAKISAARKALGEWAEGKGYRTEGSFIVAGYDPPFIPPLLQRNEVMVRLRTGSPSPGR